MIIQAQFPSRAQPTHLRHGFEMRDVIHVFAHVRCFDLYTGSSQTLFIN